MTTGSTGDGHDARAVLPAAIRTTRVIAILRGARPDRLLEAARVLTGAGIRCVEFPLSAPESVDALREFAGQAPPGVAVGAGTVLGADTVDLAVNAGARFLLTPGVSTEVLARAARHRVPVVCGAFTATEVLTAWRAGAAAVKIFPASLGGPGYLAAIRAPLPHIPLVPTGGIGLDQVGAYLDAGAAAVGLGSPLVGDLDGDGALSELAGRAAAVIGIAGTAGRTVGEV